jgi:hypothetical protein
MNWAGNTSHPTKWVIYFLEVPKYSSLRPTQCKDTNNFFPTPVLTQATLSGEPQHKGGFPAPLLASMYQPESETI